MISILITAAFILGFLKLADKDNLIDFFGAATIYIAPLAFVWVTGIAINSFGLPPFLHLVMYLAYFVAPYLIINAICESYSTKKKVLLSSGVLAIVLLTEIAQLALAESLAA